MQLTTRLLFVLALRTAAFRHKLTDIAEQVVELHKAEKLGPIDFSRAIGSDAAKGIGPLTKSTAEGCTGWAPWGLAVSGNGLMAEAAAAGTLRALNDAGILQQLSTISSVSGGSWFNTQFGFSEAYFKGVTESESLVDWYTEYQGKAMQGFGMATSNTWEGMIAGMHKGFDPSTYGLPATSANRAGNTNADLLICTTLVGGSLMNDKTISQMKTDGKNVFYSNPAFWSVPASGEGGWTVPGVDLAKASWNAEGQLPAPDSSIILPTPSVTKVSAMSSAANGITANPELAALFKPLDQFSAMFGSGPDVPSNGVCTTDGDECLFPSMKAIDGCYVDNLGFALNVGYLQKKFPGKNLRLMAVSSELCDRTKDPTCIDGVKASAFRSLFAGGPYPAVEGWLPAIVPGPDRTIFAESITDEQALGQQTGYGGMTFTTGTFTTLQNDHFGVAAGTKVAILILNVNGPLYLQPAGGPGIPTGGADGLSDVAVNAYESMNKVLGGYSMNNKLTSEEAFLYYQSVKA